MALFSNKSINYFMQNSISKTHVSQGIPFVGHGSVGRPEHWRPLVNVIHLPYEGAGIIPKHPSHSAIQNVDITGAFC